RARRRRRWLLRSWSQANRRPDLLHRRLRDLARAARALVQDLDDRARLLGELLAPLADRAQRRQHVLEQHVLAVETADAGRAAAVRDELAIRRRREDLVQVEHRADLGIAGIRATLARRVGHHRTNLPGDLLRGVGELDRVAVG